MEGTDTELLLLVSSVKDNWCTLEKEGGWFTITVFTNITSLSYYLYGRKDITDWNPDDLRLFLACLIKLKWLGPMCISETSNFSFLWLWHSLVSASPSACRWLGLSRLRSHSVACKSLWSKAWESRLLTWCKVCSPSTFPLHIPPFCSIR